MNAQETKILKVLVDGQYLSRDKVQEIEKELKGSRKTLADVLSSKKLVTPDLLGQAFAESINIPYADLNSHTPTKEHVLLIPEERARELRVVVFKKGRSNVTVATDHPEQEGLAATLKKILEAKKVDIAYSLPEDIDNAFKHYRKEFSSTFLTLIKQKKDAPEILDHIFNDAILHRASDIHLEPQEADILVRFRVDGVLHEIGTFPKDAYETILNRIKVQSHLRTDEHFSAQDGSLRHRAGDTVVNMRISIIPTLDGEKIVLRILAEYVKGLTLADLGLSERHQSMLLEAASKPFGMILVVGPTGSGKTTTLYALLKLLNKPDINITTIEDPVEYKVHGVNHIQVNTQTNLTFAKGLRSIVRQDPDIIFLGEIRDQESAEIAVNAALTGHLLLSTFHANDAATAIPRLLDMGIERFLLSSTIEIVIAQTLVRKICESCRMSFTPTKKNTGEHLKASTLYRGKGCDVCSGTGYKGRTAIYEFIQNTSALQELILQNPSTKQVWELARKEGALSMYEDGLEKMKQGITTLEEVMRVAAPPEDLSRS